MEKCRKHGISVTAYSPLGSDGAPLIKNPVVQKLSEKYGVAPSNILISLQANRPGLTGAFLYSSRISQVMFGADNPRSDPQVRHSQSD